MNPFLMEITVHSIVPYIILNLRHITSIQRLIFNFKTIASHFATRIKKCKKKNSLQNYKIPIPGCDVDKMPWIPNFCFEIIVTKISHTLHKNMAKTNLWYKLLKCRVAITAQKFYICIKKDIMIIHICL